MQLRRPSNISSSWKPWPPLSAVFVLAPSASAMQDAARLVLISRIQQTNYRHSGLRRRLLFSSLWCLYMHCMAFMSLATVPTALCSQVYYIFFGDDMFCAVLCTSVVSHTHTHTHTLVSAVIKVDCWFQV